MEVGSVLCHWTFLCWDDEYVLVRSTGGGNLGAEGYMPSHVLNVIGMTRKLFGSAFVGIANIYGCSRSINYKNSTQIA